MMTTKRQQLSIESGLNYMLRDFILTTVYSINSLQLLGLMRLGKMII